MQFNSNSDNQDIISDITFLLGLNTNSYTLKDRTRNVNERYRMIWQMIFESYSGIKFQDDNLNSNPYGDINVTSGTATGAWPTGAVTVRGAQLKDSNGNYHDLVLITEEEYLEMGGDAVWNGQTGFPTYIMFYEDTWKLLPAPNYTLASALRIYCDWDISAFASTDTTKVPGFAPMFHRMLSIGAALDYAMARNLKDKVVYLQQLWNDYEKRLRDFYSKRYWGRFPHRLYPGNDLVEEYR